MTEMNRCKGGLILNNEQKRTVNDQKGEIYFTLQQHTEFCKNECKKTDECNEKNKKVIIKLFKKSTDQKPYKGSQKKLLKQFEKEKLPKEEKLPQKETFSLS